MTGFYLPMGATLIQHSWKAVFGSLKSLDEPRFSLGASGRFPPIMLRKFGTVIANVYIVVMSSIFGTIFARESHTIYVKYIWHGSCIGQNDNDSHYR